MPNLDFVPTGPETLAGGYMRIFRQPIYRSADLKAGRAVPLRIMNEDFALYRGRSGAPFVVGPRCTHRPTNHRHSRATALLFGESQGGEKKS
jgi:5,5'-dehydrodivanillate O-demethylase